MAFKDKHKQTEEKILDVDAEMSGSLVFKDPVNLRINGKFEGTLETRGNLVIGPTAVVKASIVGDDIVVAGRIKGEILAKQRLTLLDAAIVEGQIKAAKLIVNEGAIFEGVCHMFSDFFNLDELSGYLGVDVPSVNEWANSGKIPAIKEGEAWKFERKSIDEWVSAGKLR